MIRLAIVCIIISLANGSNYDASKINLQNLKKSLLESEKYLNKQPKNEDSVILFGNTNSGKSTLINYLIGNKLKAVKISQFEPLKIMKVENGSKGPEMGSGSQSKNTIPTRWSSKKLNDLTLWDAPDMDDNEEEMQDIVRSFYFFKLIKNVKSLKIILVINIRDIEDDRKNYLSLLTAMENIFGNHFEEYFSSTSVIFTKVRNTSEIPVDYKYIGYHLEKHFLNDSGLKWSQVSKNFTRFLLANNDRIALLKEMSHDGDVTSEIDFNIFTAIEKSKIIPKSSLQDLRPSISNSLKLGLFQSSETLHANIAIKEIKNILEKKFDKMKKVLDNSIKNEDEVKRTKKELLKYRNTLHKSLKTENDFVKKVKYLYNVDVEIREKVEEHELLKNFQLITSIENLLAVKISKPLNFLLNSVVFSTELYLQSVISIANMKIDILLKNKGKEKMKDVVKEQSTLISIFEEGIEKYSTANTSIFNFVFKRIQEHINKLSVMLILKDELSKENETES